MGRRAAQNAEARLESLAPWQNSDFQISQRADYINNDLFEWVQFNRAIINTRDEPLADPRRYRRLHLLHGDTSDRAPDMSGRLLIDKDMIPAIERGEMFRIAAWEKSTTNGGSLLSIAVSENQKREDAPAEGKPQSGGVSFLGKKNPF
ncbi:MAG: hypothetical protein CMO80_00535 [Verrucomicrobiales bacterium]|nr:hypothetical protein [Verrucomicrobiales bacterium]|tara:strand:+ start:154 stop:597 length:444 start_codon:yes stop_codon:yes gene_type:complete